MNLTLSLCVTKLFPAEGLWLELLAVHKILTATMQWKNTIHTNTQANMHKGTYTQMHQTLMSERLSLLFRGRYSDCVIHFLAGDAQ